MRNPLRVDNPFRRELAHVDGPTPYQLAILTGLQQKARGEVFAGIDPLHTTKPLARNVIRRRAANRVARRSRRVNRMRAA